MHDPDEETLGARGDRTGRGVLLLHSWWGLTPSVEAWADDLVQAGHHVLVPDLYGGRTAGTQAEAEALADALDRSVVDGLLDRCAEDLGSGGRPWAAMGWSLGAWLACGLADRDTGAPQDLVLFYGGRPVEPGRSRTSRVGLHVVPDDDWFSDDEVAQVQRSFTEAGSAVETHTYAGCGHWFAEPGSPAFHAEGHALARTRVLAQLGR